VIGAWLARRRLRSETFTLGVEFRLLFAEVIDVSVAKRILTAGLEGHVLLVAKFIVPIGWFGQWLIRSGISFG